MNRFLWYLRQPWYWIAAGLVAIAVRGLFLDLMEVDAAQYASISMEMLQNGSWLQVKHLGVDYLDKPPLLFWTGAVSFLLFGFSNWAFKLPSLLAALAGVYGLYRLCRLYYPEKTARYAAFMLAGSLGMLLLCNDVRTDTLLMGMTVCSVWQMAAFLKTNRWLHLLLAFLYAGLAMLAKGPVGLVMPALATGAHLALRRDWKQIIRWEWLAGLLVIILVLLPMCWGLYQQYDLHPEKTVLDRTGVSGLYFYFWEQSFGRITGGNSWKNDASGFYFIHVYLWAFLPWPALLIAALWQRLRDLIKSGFRIPEGEEGFSTGGFVLMFVALSMSRYKLPHYIFITLPWAAVLTARMAGSLRMEHLRSFFKVQYLVCGVVLAIAWLVPLVIFPESSRIITLILLFMTAFWIRDVWSKPFPAGAEALVLRTAWTGVILGIVLNFQFYPSLLPYQSTSVMMKEAREKNIPPDKMAWYRRYGHALDFYNRHLVTKMYDVEQIRQTASEWKELWLYTTEEGKTDLDWAGIPYEVVLRGRHFQVALLKFKFLNPATRQETLEPVYVLKIAGQ